MIDIKKISIKVLPEDNGKKIKSILRNRLGISSSLLTELKKYPDGIMLDKKSVFANHIVNTGDSITITLKDVPSPNIEAKDIPLDIIYEDEELLVINKSRNMPSHPSQNHHDDTLANAVMYKYKDTDFTFRIITRLDKDTSGVVVIAKDKLTASRLTMQMQSGMIEKEYIAICHNIPKDKKGTINAPIGRKDSSLIVREVTSAGKDALTDYETVISKDNLSLLKLHPVTGRTHQIRVHLAHIGCPIYADDMYGSPVKSKSYLLHCAKVSLYHPETNKKLSFEAKTPKDMEFIFE